MSKLFVNTIAPNSGDTVTVSGSLTTTGKLTIGDATSDTVSFVSEISSSLIPDVGATYDLGTMANSWRNLHAHGLGHIHTASINVVSSSLLPDTGATYALGTMAKSWGSLHVHGLAHIHTASINRVSSSLLPDADNTYDLGSSAKRWNASYINNIIGPVTINTASINKMNSDFATIGSASFVGISSSLIPSTGATYALGTMAQSWGSAHIHGLAHIHTASIGVVTSSLIPDKDSAFDLGSSTKEWKDLYIDGTANVDAISIEKTTAASQDLNTSAEYSVNGSKVEVRAITDSSIADGAFATFKLLNTSIATDSVIYGAFTGNHSNSNMSSSIISVATIAASTASVFIHNETGGAIAADTPFTASFIVL